MRLGHPKAEAPLCEAPTKLKAVNVVDGEVRFIHWSSALCFFLHANRDSQSRVIY